MGYAHIALTLLFIHLGFVACQQDDQLNECGPVFTTPTGLDKIIDTTFFARALKSLVPYQKPDIKMQFYLFKKAFPRCAQEIRLGDDSLQKSGFNASQPTRILIHGWMSQGRSDFNRDILQAYLSIGDFNIIVADWSIASHTVNYFKVVPLIENFGGIVANFTRHLQKTMGVKCDDIYLIGHSLGAQIAGSAGKQVSPEKYNTIFALDPAGPAFRDKDTECRIDPSDAKYVESIQTSVNLGFMEPVGNATFLPNKGVYQGCIGYGCSHKRAYRFFAESLTSNRGFWGTTCTKEENKKPLWDCPEKGHMYKMGGEPSQPKTGVFYVKTSSSAPYALGRFNKYTYA